MPYSIRFENLPVGYAAAPARRGDEAPVIVAEFVSSDDGDVLIQRLEGIPTQILHLLPAEAGLAPSAVRALLAVIHRDHTATVYLNDEVQIVARALAKRPVQAGEPLRRDDIADIQEITLADIDIPRSAGVVFVFSVGWRKGLFYDLGPIQPSGAKARKYDLAGILGGLFNYLVFNDLFKISDEDWKRLFNARLFPFHRLKRNTIQQLISHLREGWDLGEVVEQIASEVDEMLEGLIAQVRSHPSMSEHLAFVEAAAKHYREGDFLSSISVLYPRIEGVMRSHHLKTGRKEKPTPGNMVTSALGPTDIPFRSLLPDRFGSFLTEVYFKEFHPDNPEGVSRHTVSHGVASADEYSRTGAMLGFLILSQLGYFLAGFGEHENGPDS